MKILFFMTALTLLLAVYFRDRQPQEVVPALADHYYYRVVAIDDKDGLSTQTQVYTVKGLAATQGKSYKSYQETHMQDSVTQIIPVCFEDVRLCQYGRLIEISWTSFTEINVKKYLVEQSINGTNWKTEDEVVPTTAGSTYKSISTL